MSQTPTPRIGHPIDLQSASKILFEEDYRTADGLFRVERFYQSSNRGRFTDSEQEIAGFGKRWHGLVPGHMSVGIPGSIGQRLFDRFEYLPIEGGIESFAVVNRSNLSSFELATQEPSRYRASMVVAPSVTREAYFQAPANTASTGEVRLDFPNGDYLLFRRVGIGATSGGTQRMMVPTEHHLASGYTRFFDYQGDATTPYRIRDSFGRQMLLSWQAVTSSAPCYDAPSTMCAGPGIESQPLLTNIVLPDASSLAYTYELAPLPTSGGGLVNRLATVRRLSATNVVIDGSSYLYENSSYPYALTGVLDLNNARIATYTYDTSGRPSSTELAGGVDRYTVEHRRLDESNQLRIVTNPLGLQTTYQFSRTWFNDAATFLKPRSLVSMETAATANVPAQTRSWTYGNDLVTQSADARAVVSRRENPDSQGRPLIIREAFGLPEVQSTALEWHPVRDLPESEQKGNLRIEYDYDAQSRVIERREIDVSTQTLPYPTSGQTRIWTYQWLANGRLDMMNGPRAPDSQGRDDTEDYAYDAAGNLESVTNGMGHVTRFESFDANGRPKRMYDANNVQTRFTYDALGRMTEMSVRQPGGTAHAVTTFEYDIEHRIVGITRPATARLGMAYDLAGRMTEISAPTGEKIAFTYDAMGNVVRQRTTDSANAQRADIQRTFDELGRMITQTLGPGRTWQFAYDNQDNPTRTTSARNFATDQAFDGLARLIRTVHPDTGEDEQGYNSNDDLTTFTDPLEVETGFTHNGFGQVIREVSPDRGTTVYRYSSGGDLESVLDARGQQVDYTHDILGRVTSRSPVGLMAQAVTYTYDTAGISGSYGVGRLARIDDASGNTHFKYDHRGNMVQRQQTIAGVSGISTQFAYDLADRISRITYPSGREVDYGRDAQGRVNSVITRASGSATSQTLLSDGLYEPFGALATATFGNGQLYKQTRDANGRLTARRYRTTAGVSLWSVGYGYDADDNITSITDLVDANRTIAYQYDTVDRLARIERASGTTRREDFVHDVSGNRMRVEYRALPSDPAPASQDTYNRTTGTNRIASIANVSGTRSRTPDARGNLSAEDRPGTNDVTVGYDGYARLTSYMRLGETNLSMAYNGMDQRVALMSGSVTRRFVQDSDGRLLGEYAANASQPFSEYIWMLPEVIDGSGSFGGDEGMGGWSPLAVATADGAGSMTTLHWLQTDHLGRPVATYNVSSTATALPATTTNLSYPGQQHTLADLWYNQYRDYDPTTGSYIQADPIGLAGDVNPYVYAEANPVGMVDPLGLARYPDPRPNPPGVTDWCGSTGTERTPDFWFVSRERGFGYVRVSLRRACQIHDECYGSDSCSAREDCDEEFGRNVLRDCTRQGGSSTDCRAIAALYRAAVERFGADAYQGRAPPRRR